MLTSKKYKVESLSLGCSYEHAKSIHFDYEVRVQPILKKKGHFKGHSASATYPCCS